MATWVLVIMLLANRQPVSISSVSGYPSQLDCTNAGNRLHDEEMGFGRQFDFDCIPGPAR